MVATPLLVDIDGDGTGDENLEAEFDPEIEGDEKPIEAQVKSVSSTSNPQTRRNRA